MQCVIIKFPVPNSSKKLAKSLRLYKLIHLEFNFKSLNLKHLKISVSQKSKSLWLTDKSASLAVSQSLRVNNNNHLPSLIVVS